MSVLNSYKSLSARPGGSGARGHGGLFAAGMPRTPDRIEDCATQSAVTGSGGRLGWGRGSCSLREITLREIKGKKGVFGFPMQGMGKAGEVVPVRRQTRVVRRPAGPLVCKQRNLRGSPILHVDFNKLILYIRCQVELKRLRTPIRSQLVLVNSGWYKAGQMMPPNTCTSNPADTVILYRALGYLSAIVLLEE